jgi:hypothetical protein
MLIERQYYGLLSGLPALELGKCPPPPWEALWQQSAAFVDADTQTMLTALYLPYEHLPLMLGQRPAYHPYPLQFEVGQLKPTGEQPLPYLQRDNLLVLRQQPLAQGLAVMHQLWQSWIRAFEVPMLQQYLDFSNELEHYRLQWQASEQEALRDLLHDQEMPALSTLETALEQRLMPGELQQLVHGSNSFDKSLQADGLRWRWLEDQVFHEQFGLNALIAYALRQQMSWHWYVAPDFSADHFLSSTLQKMLD